MSSRTTTTTPLRRSASAADRTWCSTTKVVDSPHHRSHSSSRKRFVDATNQYATADLPGPSSPPRGVSAAAAGAITSSSGVVQPHQSTPRRRMYPGGSPISAVSPSPATLHRNVSLLVARDSSLDEIRYSRRMVMHGTPTRGISPRHHEGSIEQAGNSAASPPMFSKRMHPSSGAETVRERNLSTASSDIELGRGRAHSPSHRNYTDHIRSTWLGTGGLGAHSPGQHSNGTSSTARLSLDAATEAALFPTARPQLRTNGQKNMESRTDAAHWKPTVEKRCVSSQPSLVGIMNVDPPSRAPTFRLVPPYGVSPL